MPRSLKEKFKYFWGFETEEDELLDEEYETSEYNGSEEYTAAPKRDDNMHVFPSNTKNKVVNIHNNANIKIEIFRPKSFEQAVDIVDCLRSKRPVVVNLESINSELARKIFDFLSGALCAIDGKAEKISKGIFLMAPSNVHIKGNTSESDNTTDDSIDHSVFNFRD